MVIGSSSSSSAIGECEAAERMEKGRSVARTLRAGDPASVSGNRPDLGAKREREADSSGDMSSAKTGGAYVLGTHRFLRIKGRAAGAVASYGDTW